MSGSPPWNRQYEEALNLHSQGQFAAASILYQAIEAEYPDAHPVWNADGILDFQSGEVVRGVEKLEKACHLDSRNSEYWSNLGNAYRILHRYEDSAEVCRKAVELNDQNAAAHNNLAGALRFLHEIDDANYHVDRAIEIAGPFREAMLNRACTDFVLGLNERGTHTMSELIKADPTLDENWYVWLFQLGYGEGIPNEDFRQAHSLFGSRFHEAPRPVPTRIHPQRIGFVSGDLYGHPVGKFMMMLLEHFDKSQFQIVAFSNSDRKDDVTRVLMRNCSEWHMVAGKPIDQVYSIVRQADVDVLIDLSGHSSANLLPLFAKRPAPVQATYLGYSATTGLSQMDFFIADSVTIPPEYENSAVEQIIRLPDSCFCFPGVEVAPKPAKPAGSPIVFGSFNNPMKITETAMLMWAEILRQVPDSRLIVKYMSLGGKLAKENYSRRFIAAGIPEDQFEIHGSKPYEKHLEMVRSVDISLDTPVYNGATTTVDALTVATPVVTWAGERYNQRMAASILSAVGLDELVTHSGEEYIQLAVKLATDHAYRNEVEMKIVEQWPKSALVDGRRFAIGFENAIFDMWKKIFPSKT